MSETIPRKSTTDFELLKANLRSASRLNAEYRYEEADALVRDTIAQFPEVSDASAHYVQLAWARGDLLVTVERAEDGRNRFPDNPECYLKAADALRLLGSFDRSEALVADGLQRFPKHPGFIIQAALLAEIRGDWSGVEAWMARLRELFPDRAMSWVQSASSLLRGSRTEAADALLVEALARFPNEPELHALRATVAEDQRRWDEADRRWQSARANFPDDPSIALKHALVWGRPPRFGAVARDMPEVFERFEQLHAAFPDFARGYSAHIGQLHNDAKLDDAEALARLARARFPDDVHVAIEAARVAMAQENTNAAIGILTESASKIPNSPLIPAELVAILAETGRLEEAEAVCAAACARFRSHARLFIEFAELAMRREDFPEALLRWTDGSKRFPQEVSFQRGVARARLRLIGRGHDPGSEEPADEEFTETDISVRRLLLNFESLGGAGNACELGWVQRLAGAEPLSLLRWTGVSITNLTEALRNRLEGVGTPEQTDVLVPANHSDYEIVDRRYAMRTHTFIREGATPRDQIFEESCRHTAYLKNKLLRDLAAAKKIFVFQFDNETTEATEIENLYNVLQSYGETTLLCVTKGNNRNEFGSVEVLKPRLLMGYVKKVAAIGMTETASWHEVCRRAYDLVRREPAPPTGVAFTISTRCSASAAPPWWAPRWSGIATPS